MAVEERSCQTGLTSQGRWPNSHQKLKLKPRKDQASIPFPDHVHDGTWTNLDPA